MRLIVVGAGNSARSLLRRINEAWEVTVVDPDPARLERIGSERVITAVAADGTRPDVLYEAGLAGVDAVVAAGDDDAANLAVCRIAREHGVVAAAVAADPERLADYRSLDASAASPDALAARGVVTLLETRREFSAAMAGGLAEGLDFRVVADSPVRGRPLRDITTGDWLVVAVLREGRLIVPHGGTVLQTDDIVTVIGSQEAYPAILAAFTSGIARFPADFGSSVGVALTDETDLNGPVAEAVGLARTSAAESVTLVLPATADPASSEKIQSMVGRVTGSGDLQVWTREVSGSPHEAALSWPLDGTVGLVVVPVSGRPAPIGRRRIATVCRAVHRYRRPVLFSRGATRYRCIVVPARDTPAGWSAARAAIDLCAHTGLPLTAVAVVPPLFIAGDEARDEAARAVARLQEEASVQGVSVRRVVEQGNAVRVVEQHVDEACLLVLGLAGRPPSTTIPGILGHLARRVAGSVLIVPSAR